MSSEMPPLGRPQIFELDEAKLHLLNALNQLRLETWIFYAYKGSFSRAWHLTKKQSDDEVTKFIVSMNERLDYLLEIAKNLLKNPVDVEGLEYRRFEDMANRIVRQRLLKPKYGGLKKKAL
jgi:hypothetical protein